MEENMETNEGHAAGSVSGTVTAIARRVAQQL
jgi:hypothetical protein